MSDVAKKSLALLLQCNQRKAKVAKQSDSTEIEEYAMIPEK